MFQSSAFLGTGGASTRRATRRRRRPTTVDRVPVMIRDASPADDGAIARLAALEERPALPRGKRLVGEVDGEIVAALDVRSGRAVADPFVSTSGIVDLLGMRAAQVR